MRVESYQDMARMLDGPLGRWGGVLFIAALGIACFGAALEVTLSAAYLMAQGFGWRWSEDVPPREAARFALVYTLLPPLAAIPIVLGIAPLALTVFSMAVTSATLPLVVGPLFLLMNDRAYVGRYRNGVISNAVIVFTAALAFTLAVVTIPLVIAGG
jgi:Mn2+/Fe2+ NRAMP family transporter